MENYDVLINEINKVLDTAESLSDSSKRFDYLNSHIKIFEDFNNSIILIIMQYHFTENSDILKNITSRLLGLNDFFENIPHLQYFKSDLLEALSKSENKFAFSLQYSDDISQVELAMKNSKDRSELIEVLRSNNFFEGQDLNNNSAVQYASNQYDQNMYGHALIQLKKHFLTLPKEKVMELIRSIDNAPFLQELISKDYKKMNFYEQNLLFQYCDSVLRMKSIFAPKKFNDDGIIKAMWSGKIADSKTLKCILESTSINSFASLLQDFDEESKDCFFTKLAEHFQSVNMDNSNISLIIRSALEKNSLSYYSAFLLAKIDLPNDYSVFMDSTYAESFPWLTDFNTFDALKSKEKAIEDAYHPLLPAEYYIEKISKLGSCPNINENFIENLLVLMHSDYYSPEDKQALQESLINASLWNETEYERLNQPLPLDEAKRILNADLSGSQPIDKFTLKQCIKSIITNGLAQDGVSNQYQIFFGNGHKEKLGYCDPSNFCIWIDDNLLDEYLNAPSIEGKANLFRTAFHEKRHAVQSDNIQKGNIDFITYHFIKESIIEQYDPDFYQKIIYEFLWNLMLDNKKLQILLIFLMD